ncbi:hypothetical protein GF359_07675 [candidate division WOR-3 bacterium]|uniref:Uncharacterized protein n=1 Tax=candidate division WOR-3 bacterium TaxID=2052148 RepID=A0A9D5KBF6_UNCW3|nr:hypothetical protein [candidate division WOR-3 bacterium]MBD3365080.1 hypothetical protein [candidate division WOR-3 bacterium]
MNKRIIVSVLTLILLMGFTGCEESAYFPNPSDGATYVENQDAGSSPYFPYEPGNRWRYEYIVEYVYDYPEEFPTEDTTWTDTTASVTVVTRETQLTGSNPLAVWEIETTNWMSDTSEPTVSYSWVHIEGDSVYTFDDISASEPDMVSPANPELGDKWEYEYEVDDTTTDTIYYEVVAEGVEANGYDDCIKIEVIPYIPEEIETFEQYQYMAKGTGTVLFTSNMLMRVELGPLSELVVTMEGEYKLTSFTGIVE